MPLSKHSFIRKQQKQKQQPRQKKPRNINDKYNDIKNIQINVYRCDLCNNPLAETGDDLEYRINVVDEINDSYESEHDKVEPRLLLCLTCSKGHMIPSYC
jgi:hypothetical protein